LLSGLSSDTCQVADVVTGQHTRVRPHIGEIPRQKVTSLPLYFVRPITSGPLACQAVV
jgi:hypothetical protein